MSFGIAWSKPWVYQKTFGTKRKRIWTRACKIFEKPRNILKKIPGLEFVEMARNRLDALCCGGGGGMQAYNPDMAVHMASERVRGIPKQERGKIKIMDITEMVTDAPP